MSPQPLPRRRVVSPPLIPATESPRLSAVASHLWPSLPPQTQAQLAQILAELLRRTLPAHVTPGREISRVDRRQCR
jgi:hypothetical protein